MEERVRVVGDRMVPCPWVLAPGDSMSKALAIMREHSVRHIPVVHDGEVVGIVSERDLDTMRSRRDVDPHEVTLREAMTAPVYTVSPDTPLAEVARAMADNKYGAAVIARGRRILGVFTTTDALCELARLLEGHSDLPPTRC
jgi:acetoin utilization protein AcuB